MYLFPNRLNCICSQHEGVLYSVCGRTIVCVQSSQCDYIHEWVAITRLMIIAMCEIIMNHPCMCFLSKRGREGEEELC